MKNFSFHIIYGIIIFTMLAIFSASNVIEDELRIEIACKNFLLELLESKKIWTIWQTNNNTKEY